MDTLIDPPKKGFDKTNAYIAGFIFLFTMIIYRLTVAPTFSYWDCGEFIACSYILGIPHPPGSPLFILIGRIFSILPISADICFRVNILSIISSAAAIVFGYLSVVRIIRYWFNENDTDTWSRFIPYIGGFVGSLFMAFASTYWANAVEAEVYGLALMIMTMILWLLLIYYDVQVRVKDSFVAEMHLDTDDANASGIRNGDRVKIILSDEECRICNLTRK